MASRTDDSSDDTATTRQRISAGGDSSAGSRPGASSDSGTAIPAGRKPYLIVLAGPRVGEVIPVHQPLLIGREPRSGLHLLDEGVSRRHCTVAPEGKHVRLTDLDSTNGTWIGGKRVRSHLLSDGERFRVGQTTVIKFALQDAAEEQQQRELFEVALRDPQTRAFNRRYFVERLDAEVAYADRHQVPLALLCINVDRFEQLNSLVGREHGDRLLRELVALMAGATRTEDVLARLGDDNFAVIARDTGLDGGMKLAERLRGVVADGQFAVGEEPVELRISAGVAAIIPGRQGSADALLQSAQHALRHAKESGRNRVCAGEVTGAPSSWVKTEELES